jgi:glutamyl/glutaminyl-tRNA synthetase
MLTLILLEMRIMLLIQLKLWINKKKKKNKENVYIQLLTEKTGYFVSDFCRRNCKKKPLEKYVIRFKTPVNETLHLHDIIRGDIKFDTNLLDDKVLFKSDGMPTII